MTYYYSREHAALSELIVFLSERVCVFLSTWLLRTLNCNQVD